MSTAACFSGSALDWASQRRSDGPWLAARLADDSARFLPFLKLKPLIRLEPEPDLGWLTRARAGEHLEADACVVFLGLDGDAARFAFDLSSSPAPVAAAEFADIGKFIDVRSIAAQLEAGRAAILAQARPLLDWHDRHGFCANCGAPSELRNGGHLRRCGECGAEHFPRTDPVVIMLPIRDGRCLLGNNRRFPGTLYSALAGFLEPGESIEDAVKRETREEVGIEVAAVRYIASQPWPFPSSLMIGCFAEAESTEITLDREELLDARWFTRAELAAALGAQASGKELDGVPLLPPPLAIAHTLMRIWIDETN